MITREPTWSVVGRVSGVWTMTCEIPGREPVEQCANRPMVVTVARLAEKGAKGRSKIDAWGLTLDDCERVLTGWEADAPPILEDKGTWARIRVGPCSFVLRSLPGESVAVEYGEPRDGISHLMGYLRTWRLQQVVRGADEWVKGLSSVISRAQQTLGRKGATMKTAIKIPVEGPVEVLHLTGDDEEQLQILQSAVDGLIECVKFDCGGDDLVMVMNEEGEGRSLERNGRAGVLMNRAGVVLGDVVVTGTDDGRGGINSLTERQAAFLLAL